eukprot:CCRYP_012310-RB/>CCRYP_012310-RB protein AED:0.08 eAED:0.08 QI:4744/1/1/1/0.33/0.25/4/138/319
MEAYDPFADENASTLRASLHINRFNRILTMWIVNVACPGSRRHVPLSKMSDSTALGDFEHVLNVTNINLISYLSPKDLFHLSCASKQCKKVVGDHLFDAFKVQLEAPIKLKYSNFQRIAPTCSVKFSKGRTFPSKAELLDFVCAKWRPDSPLWDRLRLIDEDPDFDLPDLLDALREIKRNYSRDFFYIDKPHISVVRDEFFLRTDCDFTAKLLVDSSGVRSAGRESPFSFLQNSPEKEILKNWTSYLIASNIAAVDCWQWDIDRQYPDPQYWLRPSRKIYFGFSCVFSKREGGEELELFADVMDGGEGFDLFADMMEGS